jgi:threonine/homoserine/homoserine lactone efflux protein
METSLTPANMMTLFGVMVVLAAIPGISVLLVTTRSAACGFVHGIFTTMGVVAGDIIYILIAIFGLALLAETMGNMFILIKFLGGAYLIWLGASFWLSEHKQTGDFQHLQSSRINSFMAGLLLTLGDQKAILFYLAFFPVFLDLNAMTVLDALIIMTITIAAVGGVKLVYAYMADRANWFSGSRTARSIKILAGTVMIATGLLLLVQA